MELTDDNLVTLSEYLKHTLSPEVTVRRPGRYNLQTHHFCDTLNVTDVPHDNIRYIFQPRSFSNRWKSIRIILYCYFIWWTSLRSTSRLESPARLRLRIMLSAIGKWLVFRHFLCPCIICICSSLLQNVILGRGIGGSYTRPG